MNRSFVDHCRQAYWNTREWISDCRRACTWHSVLYKLRLDADGRHKATARIRGEWAARFFQARRLRLGNRPVVAIALVEHMGDIVAAEPVSRWLRARHPEAHIVWFVGRAYAPLVACYPAINEVVRLGCLTEWITIRKRVRFDQLADLHIQERICPICKTPLHKPEAAREVTLASYYDFGSLLTAQCLSAGLPILTDGPLLKPDATARHVVDELKLPQAYVTVHCASNETCRDWPLDRWLDTVRWLERNYRLAVVEVGVRPRLSGHALGNYHDLCGRLSLPESAELIRRSRFFVGIDSGPAHLANAVDTFGVILLGQYRTFKHYVPYSGAYANGENAILLVADGPVAELDGLSVRGALAEAVRRSALRTAKRE